MNYIGVTGFSTSKELHEVEKAYDNPKVMPHFMAGILMSHKTLKGLPATRPNRYPRREDVLDIRPSLSITHKIIHYSTDDPDGLLTQLFALAGLYWRGKYTDHCDLMRSLDGFQLNVAWPSPKIIEDFWLHNNKINRHFAVILQVGQKALDAVGNSPHQLALRLRDYNHHVDHVLIDPSGGESKLMNVELMRSYLYALNADAHDFTFNLGVASGLCAENAHTVAELVRDFGVSVDGEGKFRDEHDRFVPKKAHDFVKAMLDIHYETGRVK